MSFAGDQELEDALDVVKRVLVFSSKDWSDDEEMSILYAILVGWSPKMLEDQAIKHGWSAETVDRYQTLRAAVASAQRPR